MIPTDTDFTVGWAINTVSDTLTQKHTQAGSIIVNLAEVDDDIEVPGGAVGLLSALGGALVAAVAVLAF